MFGKNFKREKYYLKIKTKEDTNEIQTIVDYRLGIKKTFETTLGK